MHPLFNIQKAKPDDTSLILQMVKELADYEKLLDQVVTDEKTLHNSLFVDPKGPEVLIAKEGDEPVGFVLFFHNFSTLIGRKGLYIEDIYVRDQYRHHGYGALILKELCRIAKERNCGSLEWWVHDWNEDAINFYKGIGAKPKTDCTLFVLTEAAAERLSN